MSFMESVFQQSIQNKRLMVPQHGSGDAKVLILMAFTGSIEKNSRIKLQY